MSHPTNSDALAVPWKRSNGPSSNMIQAHQRINQTSGDVEYYTPPSSLEAARLVLGTIDLDPASSAAANECVNARPAQGLASGSEGVCSSAPFTMSRSRSGTDLNRAFVGGLCRFAVNTALGIFFGFQVANLDGVRLLFFDSWFLIHLVFFVECSDY